MAIEDAMILARALIVETQPDRAFALYEATRRDRVKRATDRAATQGRLYEGEPDENTLKPDQRGDLFSYDATSATLGAPAPTPAT